MQIEESILRDIFRVIVWFPLRWVIKIIPIDLSFFFFKLMGDLHFVYSEKKRKVLHNIKTILNIDSQTAKSIVKRYYEAHYVDRLHIFLYPKLTDKKKIENYVYFKNLEVLETELRKKKGALLVQPHFGPVQITLLSLSLLGYKPYQIGYLTDRRLSKIGQSVSFRYRLKYEAMLSAPIFLADQYIGKIYKYLVKGNVVLTTGDGAGGGVLLGEHRRFNFLGTQRMFPLGPAKLAIKTRAAFIPTFIIAERYDRFRIVFETPIKGIYNDIEKDTVYMTEKFISIAEEYIKKYPYCWHFWDELE